MKRNQNQHPNFREWKSLPVSIKLYIVWIIFKSAYWTPLKENLTKKIQKIDLWTFPTAAFWASYKATSSFMPSEHPMSFIATITTALMTMTLTLFLIRPTKKILAHWIR